MDRAALECVAALFRIREALDSNIGPLTECPKLFRVFPQFNPGKFLDSNKN
jgi:hypothetical protein